MADEILGVGGVKMIEGDDKIRALKCRSEISAILMSYDCILVPEMRIMPGHIDGAVKVYPKPRDSNNQRGG